MDKTTSLINAKLQFSTNVLRDSTIAKLALSILEESHATDNTKQLAELVVEPWQPLSIHFAPILGLALTARQGGQPQNDTLENLGCVGVLTMYSVRTKGTLVVARNVQYFDGSPELMQLPVSNTARRQAATHFLNHWQVFISHAAKLNARINPAAGTFTNTAHNP